jgi:hypothetical protein
VTAKILPPDTFSYLQALLEAHSQLGMALTIDARREPDLAMLSPLVDAMSVVRLTGLRLEECGHLLREPVTGMYTLSDESIAAIHRATGGHPHLLQCYGYHLFHYWQAHLDEPVIPESAVNSLAVQVYNDSEKEFKETWQGLTLHERLVLTASGSLLYADPLRKIDTEGIEAWLVETDYPIDSTAINAAIRSLEYDEIVGSTPQGIVISAGLMQKWLLENAQLGEAPAGVRGRSRFSVWLFLAALIAVLGLIALALAIPRLETRDAPVPTVTLPF